MSAESQSIYKQILYRKRIDKYIKGFKRKQIDFEHTKQTQFALYTLLKEHKYSKIRNLIEEQYVSFVRKKVTAQMLDDITHEIDPYSQTGCSSCDSS